MSREATLGLGDALIEAIVHAAVERTKDELRGDLGAGPWMNVDAAAKYVDFTKKRIQNLTAAKVIPHRKQGGRVLYHRDELDRWLDDHYEGPTRFRRG